MSLARAAANRLLWIFVSLVVLTLLLAAVKFATDTLNQHKVQLNALNSVDKALEGVAAEELSRATSRMKEVRQLPAAALSARLQEIERKLTQYAGREEFRAMPPHRIALLAMGGNLADQVRLDIQLELWRQEQTFLRQLLHVADFRTLSEQIKSLEQERDLAYAAREVEAAKFREAESKVSLAERSVNLIYKTPDVVAMEQARDRYHAATRKHSDLYYRTAQLINTHRSHPGRTDPGTFTPTVDAVTEGIKQVVASASSETREKINSHWFQHFAGLLWPLVVTAAGVIAMGVVLYVLWKLLFFYIVAPWVSRRPAIHIEPGSNGAIFPGEMPPSSVSLRIQLVKGQEMLIQDAYLQDSPTGIRASTRLFLNAGYPIVSIASGMYALTHVEADGPVAVTVSSTMDPLDELVQIPLSPASGFVLLPRYLVGVVQSPEMPIVIKSVWRLFSLQAWLTFQFRYLVFYGPGTAIVRGCRGVRIDRPDSQRRVSQAATMGFSACLAYSNGRAETFAPYFLGIKPLFVDIFSGDGFYAYQEVASSQGAGGGQGRVMGVFDALLKPFGI